MVKLIMINSQCCTSSGVMRRFRSGDFAKNSDFSHLSARVLLSFPWAEGLESGKCYVVNYFCAVNAISCSVK